MTNFLYIFSNLGVFFEKNGEISQKMDKIAKELTKMNLELDNSFLGSWHFTILTIYVYFF